MSVLRMELGERMSGVKGFLALSTTHTLVHSLLRHPLGATPQYPGTSYLSLGYGPAIIGVNVSVSRTLSAMAALSLISANKLCCVTFPCLVCPFSNFSDSLSDVCYPRLGDDCSLP